MKLIPSIHRRPICAVITLLLASELLCGAESDMVAQPDRNTLWRQSNERIALSSDHSKDNWSVTEPLSVDSDGTALVFNAAGTGYGVMGCYVRLSPKFPYLQFDVSSVQNGDGFREFLILPMKVPGAISPQVVGQMVEGHFVGRLLSKGAKLDRDINWLRFDVANVKFRMTNLEMVAEPPRRIEVTPVDAGKDAIHSGDKFKITVHLTAPAEDVSVGMFDTYTMRPQPFEHGPMLLQLKPVDKEAKIWSGVASVKKFVRIGKMPPDGVFNPGQFIFKAVILGGGVDAPLWQWSEIPFVASP
jgi:hypothetical protein